MPQGLQKTIQEQHVLKLATTPHLQIEMCYAVLQGLPDYRLSTPFDVLSVHQYCRKALHTCVLVLCLQEYLSHLQ